MVSFSLWYQLPAIAGGLLSLGLALFAWRNRATSGARPTAILFILLAIWGLGSVFEVGAQDMATKCLLVKFEYLGLAFVPVACFVMLLDYLGYGHVLTMRKLALLCVIPTATILLNWTNDYHHLFYSHIKMVHEHGMLVLRPNYAFACWIFIAYAYLLFTAALVICILAITKTSAIYQRQAMLIFCCMLLPVFTEVAYITHLPIIGFMELTPLTFALSAGFLLWGIVYYRLLKLTPIAHQMIVQSIADGVIVLDAFNHVVEVNPTACRMLGLPREMILPGGLATLPPAWANLSTQDITIDRDMAHIITPDDAAEPVYEARIMPLETKGSVSVGRIMLVRDITERRRLDSQLQRLAFYDLLTELPNRALFFDRMEQALARNARKSTKTALLFLDLDQFKQVNDSLGHTMGDELLRQVAQRLRTQVRDSDTLARLGGDEFVILLPDLDENFAPENVIARVQQLFVEPFLLGDTRSTMTTSIGIAIAPIDGTNTDELLSHADHAMYTAKQLRSKNASQ